MGTLEPETAVLAGHHERDDESWNAVVDDGSVEAKDADLQYLLAMQTTRSRCRRSLFENIHGTNCTGSHRYMAQ
jgi:hypothetical protein